MQNEKKVAEIVVPIPWSDRPATITFYGWKAVFLLLLLAGTVMALGGFDIRILP